VKASTIITAWGNFKADTMDVAASGELQAAAVKLMDRVGYK
jgi:iron(III) transport system substrate-binding protein